MKISLEWLRDFLPDPLTADAAAESLTHGGLPVEHVEQHGDDTVIDVEVTSNRSDCLCHLGVARELSALLGRAFRDSPVAPPQARETAPAVAVTIVAPSLCPHYTARVIRGVKVGPSPEWMRRRLEAVGLRSVNNVVDVTNYVMFELGQPLHAFDFSKIDGGRIIVREARAGESIVSLDGHERKLAAGMLVIADARGPVALAGVMGGRETEVAASTADVLLESARFDSLSVRKTARALSMRSDSSYRYERGIDPTAAERASHRATQLLVELAGGTVAGPLVQAGASGYVPKTLRLRVGRLRQVLGVDVPAAQAFDALQRLQFQPKLDGDAIEVTPPPARLDANVEIDLVEEVARVVGYDRIPTREDISIRLVPPSPQRAAIETVRSSLVAAGFYEAVTFSFVSDALRGDFTPQRQDGTPATLLRADAAVRKADGRLRPSLLPGLLEAARRNEANGVPRARFFEIGSTFLASPGGGPEERRCVGLLAAGAELRDLRGAIDLLLGRLDATRAVGVVPADHAGYARGGCGRVTWGGEPVGYLGQIDPAAAAKLSLREPAVGAELDLGPLLAGSRALPQLRPLPKFPAVRRDLSPILRDDVRYQTLEAAIRDAHVPDLEAIEYVTTYKGKPLEAGTKSVTVALVFRSPDTTLTSDAVEGSVQQIVAATRDKLGATYRS